MKVIFESQGRGKMTEKWLHKNVNISPKKTNLQKLFININKKDKFVTEENILGCRQPVFE